jgi:hypothetical protein
MKQILHVFLSTSLKPYSERIQGGGELKEDNVEIFSKPIDEYV